MPQEKRIPANIFDEMAGLKDNEIPSAENSAENSAEVNSSIPINASRLRAASIPFLSKIQKKFVKQLYNFKKLLSSYSKLAKAANKLQKETVHVKITIIEPKGYDSIKKEVEKREETKNIFQRAWDLLRNVIKKLFRFGIKRLVSAAIKKIYKILRKSLRGIVKAVRKAIKFLVKTIQKIVKIVFKCVKKLIKAIWNLIKKLFFRGKASNKMFEGEPNPGTMRDPAPARGRNRMGLRMKGLKRKESFIMKAIKRMMKKFMKFIKKLCKKVLKKILKKVIKVVIKIIIKIVAAQVIGSLIPGLGNIIMGAVSAALVVIDVLDIVNFITEISGTVSSLFSEMQSDAEDSEEDEEDEDANELDIDSMNMEEVYAFMTNLENRNLTNLEEYSSAKMRYLTLLAEQYAKEGNTDISEFILNTLDNTNDENSPNVTANDAVNGAIAANSVASIDIRALRQEIERRLAEKARLKYENKRINIFDDSEINTLLTGEEDGGPMWIAIWREFMWYIKTNMPLRTEKSLYTEACNNLLSSQIKPYEFNINAPAAWNFESSNERNTRVESAENKIINDNSNEYIDYENDSLPVQAKFNDVIDHVNNYKFDTLEATELYRVEKSKEVNAHHIKYNKFLDCLVAIVTSRNIQYDISQYSYYNSSPDLEI